MVARMDVVTSRGEPEIVVVRVRHEVFDCEFDELYREMVRGKKSIIVLLAVDSDMARSGFAFSVFGRKP